MIEIKDLHAYYGPIEALHGVNLTIGEGITALIGSNGAGKTTLLKSISGIIRRTGSIIFKGENGEEELIHKKPDIWRSASLFMYLRGVTFSPGLRSNRIWRQALSTGTAFSGISLILRNWKKYLSFSQSCVNGVNSWGGASPAESSRCLPSAGR